MSEDILKTEILRSEKENKWKLLSIFGGFAELRLSTFEGIFSRITGVDLFHDKNASICSASLSPDGKTIAFFMYIKHRDGVGFSDMGLFTVDEAGKNLSVITKHFFPFCFSHSNYGGGITWSPDSRRIAFIGKPDVDYSKRELDSFLSRASGVSPQDLCVIDLNSRRVETISVNNVYNIYSQAWSPDGREISYVNTQGQVVIHNVDSNYSRGLAKGDYPSWSKDGNWIIFRESPAAEGRYSITNPLALDKRLLCAAKAGWLEAPLLKLPALVSSCPLWSPDSRYLLLSSVDPRVNKSTHYIIDFITRRFVKFENDMIFVSWEGRA